MQRNNGGDLPRQSEYFGGLNSPIARLPPWKGTRKRIFDSGRVGQIAAAAFGLLILVGFISLVSGGNGAQDIGAMTESFEKK